MKMDTLMRMQSSYDIARTRGREGELDVEPYRPVERDPDLARQRAKETPSPRSLT